MERIAANAVLAGCGPQHLPVLVAAVAAAAEPTFNLQGLQATTNPTAPGIIVSGPIAAELGVNGGVNCLGQGAWANASIGRVFRLILQTIGRAFPGEMDRATQGQPAKYTLCLTETADANPWTPMHVERGFDAHDNAVTVFNIAGTINMNTYTKDAEQMLQVFAGTLIHPTSNDYWCGGEPWIVLAPEHAAVLAAAGLGRLQVKQRLWELSRMPVSLFSERDRQRTRRTRAAELGEIPDGASVPIAPSPDRIGLLVAGGPGTHSVYAPGFGNNRSVTQPLTAAN